jgi:hypothetical protein
MWRIYLLSGWNHLVQVGHTLLLVTGCEIGTVSLNDFEVEILPQVCPCVRRDGRLGSEGIVPLILNVGIFGGVSGQRFTLPL